MKSIKRNVLGYLKAVSQAFFFDDPWLGSGFLALLFFFDSNAFASAVIGSLIGHVYSAFVSTPRMIKAYGLLTINGLFFGLAMASLFHPSPQYYALVVAGALAVPALTKAGLEVLQHWKLSPFIAPYILAVWTIWLCRSGAGLVPRELAWSTDPVFVLSGASPQVAMALDVLASSFHAVARLVFLDSASFGILMLALVALFSPRRGFYFLFGTGVAAAVSYLFSADPAAAQHGVFAYSAGLVGLGLASFPEKFKMPTILFFCALSSVLTLAAAQFLGRQDLPILSAPYVLTLWLAILSRTPRVSVSWAKPSGVNWQALETRPLPVAASRDSGRAA